MASGSSEESDPGRRRGSTGRKADGAPSPLLPCQFHGAEAPGSPYTVRAGRGGRGVQSCAGVPVPLLWLRRGQERPRSPVRAGPAAPLGPVLGDPGTAAAAHPRRSRWQLHREIFEIVFQ